VAAESPEEVCAEATRLLPVTVRELIPAATVIGLGELGEPVRRLLIAFRVHAGESALQSVFESPAPEGVAARRTRADRESVDALVVQFASHLEERGGDVAVARLPVDWEAADRDHMAVAAIDRDKVELRFGYVFGVHPAVSVLGCGPMAAIVGRVSDGIPGSPWNDEAPRRAPRRAVCTEPSGLKH
jgi:hypothetical protein